MKKHQREHGFTLIELLVVSVIVGILATLVAMTYSGVRAKDRNSSRQATINALQSHLETYYAEATKYPSIGDLNNPAWRAQNIKGDPTVNIKDPQWSDSVKQCTGSDKKVTLSASPAAKCYSYEATTTDGSPCADAKIACTQYTLTATFEGGEKYIKTSLN